MTSRKPDDAPPTAQAYPTFWDAIPVDPPPTPRPVKESAARSTPAVEVGPTVLTVDRLEVN